MLTAGMLQGNGIKLGSSVVHKIFSMTRVKASIALNDCSNDVFLEHTVKPV